MDNLPISSQKNSLPAFSQIKPETIELTLDRLLAKNRASIAQLLVQKKFSWNNLIEPLEDLDEALSSFWLNVSHLNAVINSPALRDAYNKCLPKIIEYHTEISQNEKLFQAIKSIADNEDFKKLNSVQQKIIRDELRDFHLAGVDLPPEKKQRFAELEKRLSELMNKFEENLLDATHGWNRLVQDQTELAGIPDHAIQTALENAQQKNLSGWLFTLDAPSFSAIMTYADSRKLREEMYQAYITRASDQGPNAGKWDNSQIMQDIMQIRLELAKLLGFKNYAELSLATKTAKNTDEVLNFLQQLIDYCLPIAKKEFAELQQFAKNNLQLDELQAWDVSYASEKLSQAKYAISEEQLRPYFPEDQVLQGMFAVVNKLFNIYVKERSNVDTWHPDVRFFEIYDDQNNLLGQFYADLYARESKRGGAWMEKSRSRRLANGELQTPIAFLTCNFARPVGDKPALFVHDDVLTLFHEFGHTLHELLSKVNYPAASGTSNVPWDVVEMPSQFMENWCWEKEGLALFAKHYQSNESFPEDLFTKLLATKIFHSGMQALRQLEFALFDFRLHVEFDLAQTQQIQSIINNVRQQLALYPVPKYNRFQHGFAHIFGSSYAAGYYSYKWAEVWSSDAFAKFEEEGIFNQQTGRKFLETILEKGSSYDAMEMFIAFRGRPPKIDALLRHMGGEAVNITQGQPLAKS